MGHVLVTVTLIVVALVAAWYGKQYEALGTFLMVWGALDVFGDLFKWIGRWANRNVWWS